MNAPIRSSLGKRRMNNDIDKSRQHQATGTVSDYTKDVYRPAAIAERIETAGVAKARPGIVQTLTFAVLADTFISFAAMFSAFAMIEDGLGLGRLPGGIACSLALILAVIGGAELFWKRSDRHG